MEKINCTVTIEDKVFTNEQNQSVDYVDMRLQIFGGEFRISVKKEDKSLFQYLREQAKK